MTDAPPRVPQSPDAELWATMHLVLARNIGPISFWKLVDRCGSALAVLEEKSQRLREISGIRAEAVAAISAPETAAMVEREFSRLAESGARLLAHWEPEYPPGLRHLPDRPPLLYLRGAITQDDAIAVALVGSRRANFYGKKHAEQLARGLALAGFTVVSGLARGIDEKAHRGALEGGGRTLAVIGSGLCKLYPKDHEDLAQEIAAHGAVLSELPLDTAPDSENFPRRNRLISGLSLGVVVVQAAPKSGSLITARWASEHGKEVFAVPGPIDNDLSAGCHALIRDGAHLVTKVRDVVAAFPQYLVRIALPAEKAPDAAAPDGLADEERRVWEVLDSDPRHIDTISSLTSISIASVGAILLMMEMKHLVIKLPGMCFIRAIEDS